MIYLASPYTDPDPHVMEVRYEIARGCSAVLLRDHNVVYSPIVNCHELAKQEDMPKDIGFWVWYNFSMLRAADKLWVIDYQGWDWRASHGINVEIAFALELEKEVMLAEFNRGAQGEYLFERVNYLIWPV